MKNNPKLLEQTLLNFALPTLPYIAFQLLRRPASLSGGTPWVTPIELGSPGQRVHLMLDTGTLNTWVTASTCTTDACRAHDSFDALKSSSFLLHQNPPREEDFGPWGGMGVVFGNDVCRLTKNEDGHGGVLHEEITVMLATCYSGDQFLSLPADGGLAIPSVPDEKSTALLPLLRRQGHVRRAIASFYFDPLRGIGECRMGGLERERFDSHTLNRLEVLTIENPGLSYLWAVALAGFTVGGKQVVDADQNVQLVLDTGSSVFKAGKTMIDKFVNIITDQGKLPTTVGTFADLSKYPTLSLKLGDIHYALTPEQYFMKMSSTQWVLGFQVLDGLPEHMLVVGSVFLSTVYSAFDLEGMQSGGRAVWLATAIHPPLSAVGLWTNEFGSTLEIGPIAADGTFRGTYKSHTGATGTYPVMGVADPAPIGGSQAVSFSVTWRSLTGDNGPSAHWVSGFTGALSLVAGAEVLKTIYMLQQNLSENVPEYMATAVFPSTFRRLH